MRNLHLCLQATLLLFAITGFPSEGAECVALRGARVLAGDLAAIDDRFAAMEPNRDFGPAPKPGVRRDVDAFTLRSWLGSTEHLRPVCLLRQAERLEGADVLAAMRSAFRESHGIEWKPEDLELVRIPEFVAEKGSLRFPITGLTGSAGKDAFNWRGVLRAGERRYPVSVTVRILRRIPVLVAATDIKAGVPIDRGMLKESEEPWDCRFRSYPAAIEEVAGTRLRRAVKQGTVIRREFLGPANAIEAGKSVMVTSAAGKTEVTFHAVAQRNAREGDSFLVRGLDGKSLVRVVATGPGRAEVDSEGFRRKLRVSGGRP
jgi:flagella basal body P-ring formation protein FlgA